MIDLTLSLDEFTEADDLLTAARTGNKSDRVDLLCFQSTMKLTVVGREHTCAVQIEAAGAASFPLVPLSRIRIAAETFPAPTFRLRIEAGQVLVNRNSIKHPEIKMTSGSPRPINVPDDAPSNDLLALKRIFSFDQIRDSNLSERVQQAERKLKSAMDQATALFEFIPAEQLNELITQNLEATAKRIQSNLSAESHDPAAR